MNLAPSIAVTQNFVPQAHLVEVLKFLKDKPDQISGFSKDIENPYQLFLDKIQLKHPLMMESSPGKMKMMEHGKKRKWESITSSTEPSQYQENGFSFGFGGEDEGEVP